MERAVGSENSLREKKKKNVKSSICLIFCHASVVVVIVFVHLTASRRSLLFNHPITKLKNTKTKERINTRTERNVTLVGRLHIEECFFFFFFFFSAVRTACS